MEGSYKKMRTNDIVVGAYSPRGYYQTNNTTITTNMNTSYYGHSGINNYSNNNPNYNNNNRGRGRGRNNRGGRGGGSNNNRNRGSRGSSTFFKPTMLLDPWQDLVEQMIFSNQLSERYYYYYYYYQYF